MRTELKSCYSFIIMSMLLCLSSCSDESFNNWNPATSQEIKESTIDMCADKQLKANASLNNLLCEFNKLSTRTSTPNYYPEYYGGAYINQKGNLVVYIKNKKDVSIKKALSTYAQDDSLIYKECKYSLNELNELIERITLYKLNNNNQLSNSIYAYYIVDSENKIIVEYDANITNFTQLFNNKIFNHNSVTFIASTTKPEDISTNINLGSPISAYTGTGMIANGSIGYRAKLNGIIGFVTAGHVVPSEDTYVEFEGINFAICRKRQYSGSVDAAFCETLTPPGYTVTNIIDGTSNVLSTEISEPGAGTTVNKRGQKTGSSSGQIYSTNANFTINGITFTNLTSVNNMTADNGDSGGIVYSYVSASNTRYTLGILKGILNGKTYYCKANQINKSLGITRY